MSTTTPFIENQSDKIPNPAATPITVARGDGIGPEIMDATLQILNAAGAALDIHEIEIGAQVYEQGHTSGIAPEAWDSLRKNKVFLKAPITTPQGGGYKSLNVTVRKTLGLFANVRPCVAHDPFVENLHPEMDVVIVRENEEDTYGGIEHQQTDEVAQCLKLITRPGSERICRYAFEYAVANNRKKVSCFTKDNIMKLTDGLFHKVFEEVASEYPEIESEHWIIDIGAAKLSTAPEEFDVIVTPNLYGDILSDIAIQLTGSVGMGGSANIGEGIAMFEAIHGSAPPIAGKNIANPSGLLNAAVMMLVHIGQAEIAEKIQNAWLRTIEDGVHTEDISSEKLTAQQVGTQDFAAAVIERLGQTPQQLKPAKFNTDGPAELNVSIKPTVPATKSMVGVDVFIHWHDVTPDDLGAALEAVSNADLCIKMITNRGVKVWPNGFPETFCTDHWRCRFKSSNDQPVSHQQIIDLLTRLSAAGIDFIKTEHLCLFDGKPAYSLGQGE
ncbi:MAG: NADP-dependent isocitrate dehydrogenase [Planctomycetaceae bacterium]|nr:NADP-dependent isocitrate dehydrogenase [Planctomycetaceae bacterium]